MRWADIDAVATCSISGEKKTQQGRGYHDIHLKVDVNSLLSHFFVCVQVLLK